MVCEGNKSSPFTGPIEFRLAETCLFHGEIILFLTTTIKSSKNHKNYVTDGIGIYQLHKKTDRSNKL